MKTKMIVTAFVLFAVLAVSVGKVYARSVEIEKSGIYYSKQLATKFMLKNGIQSKEDRSSSDLSSSSSSTEIKREAEVGDDRGTTSGEDRLSSTDGSSSTWVGTVPTSSTSQAYILDDSKSSSYEKEDKSGSSSSEGSSSSSESHHENSTQTFNDHSSELNDR